MSRRVWPVVALMVLVSASPLQGQDRHPEDENVRERMSELRSEIDRLIPLVEEAKRARTDRGLQAEEIEREIAGALAAVDTFQVGLVTVITPEGQTDVARGIFEEVWGEHFTHIDRSPALQEARFVFQWSDVRFPIYVEEGRYKASIEYAEWYALEQIVGHVRSSIASVVHYDLTNPYTVDGNRQSLPVGNWAPNNAHYGWDWSETYRDVALTRSRASRSCIDGELDACKSALGLGIEPPQDRTPLWAPFVIAGRPWNPAISRAQLEEWYTPEERMMRVNDLAFVSRYIRTVWSECVMERVQESCDSLLETADAQVVPYSAQTRSSLVAHALDVGGVGAWGRLFEDPRHTPIEALEYATGESIDLLLAGWHDRVMAAQPPSYGALVPSGGLALLWVAFFATLAVRSTRWRLG